MSAISEARLVTKQRMLAKRGGKKYAVCDLCGKPLFKGLSNGAEMHELIHRSQTGEGTKARQLSYAEPICSLLCHKCHHAIHHVGGVDEKALWVRNMDIYGYHEVVKAFDAVQEAAKATLFIAGFKDASDYGL